MADFSSNSQLSLEDTMSHDEFVKYKRKKLLKKVVPLAILIIIALIFVMIKAYTPDQTEINECMECKKTTKCLEIKQATGTYKYYCEDCWDAIFK